MVKKREFDFIDEHEQVIVIYHKVFPVYIVKGEKNFLIDSGATAKAEQLHTAVNRALAGGSIHSLLLTHSHWDHTGSASYLQEKYGFDIYASRRAVMLLQKPKVIDVIRQMNQDYKKTVNDTSEIPVNMPENLNPLVEGDKIRVDSDSYFQVIETPGHTKCSVSYLLHPRGILFPGDAAGLREQDGSIKPIFLSSFNEYVQSQQKLIALDAEVLAFPHNTVIKGKDKVKEYLRKSLERTHEVKDKILTLLKKGQEIPVIAETVYMQEFPGPTLLGPKESMIANFEAIVKAVEKEFGS